jgi:PII-like signaling protein
MQGSYLRFYVREGATHRHMPTWEWLLREANRLGIRGGSAFRAMAGFGSHHELHEDRFFELAGSNSIKVEFVVSDAEARQLFDLLQNESLRFFYCRTPAECGTTPAAVEV